MNSNWLSDFRVDVMNKQLFFAVVIGVATCGRVEAQEAPSPRAKAPASTKAPADTAAPRARAKAGAPASQSKSNTGSKAPAASKASKPAAPRDASRTPKRTVAPKPAAESDEKAKATGSDESEDEPNPPGDSDVPAEPATPDARPRLTHDEALRVYAQRRAAWKDANSLVESTSAQARLSKGEKYQAAIEALTVKSREACGRLTEAVIPALFLYETDFEDQELTSFLVKAVDVFSRRSRLDEAAAIAQHLVAHDIADPQVNLAAGLGALEELNVDDAKKYLGKSQAAGPLAPPVVAMLEDLEVNRELLEHEREVRRREAAANDLPRILLATTRGEIEIELYEDDYPNAVASMLTLVSKRFYDGLPFFKVMPGFGAMAGSLYEDGTGGPGYEIAQAPNPDHPRLPTRGASA